MSVADQTLQSDVDIDRLRTRLGDRSVVLVGMMGCGKTSVGRPLAARLKLPFVDADHEIEVAANMAISEIFTQHGEDYFRAGEQRVIARLLRQGAQVLATGGGAFMNAETRSAVKAQAVSVWLKADFETLFERVSRKPTRPLLQGPDPQGTLRRLLREREPVYATADMVIDSRNVPHEQVVTEIVEVLDRFLPAGLA